MKGTIAIAVIAAFVAATIGAPAATVFNTTIDWQAVDNKVEEIRTLVKDGSSRVGSIATDENPEVGLVIIEKMTVYVKLSHATLGKIKEQVKSQSMTGPSFSALFKEITNNFESIRTDLSAELAQLSAVAQAQISDTLTTSLNQADNKEQDILALLGAVFTSRVPDWRAVDAKVEELRAGISAAVADVRQTAIADNPVVGGVIAQKLNIAAGRANEVLGRAKGAIRDQTLTVDQARVLFQELQGILDGLQTELRDQVNQLSPAAQEHIRNTLATANDQATAKAQEILALLAAVSNSRVVDWVAAEAKTEEFRRIVNSAVSAVRAAAMADNPIVGQQIAQRLNAASSQTNAAIGRAKEAIKAQTWTRAEAETLFGELQTILDGVQTDLRDQVNQLSPAAQEQIINTLNLARSQAEAKAHEILDLLE